MDDPQDAEINLIKLRIGSIDILQRYLIGIVGSNLAANIEEE